MIKKQYLGADKVKKKMLKPSEKFKFNFDWEAGDDTSRCASAVHSCLPIKLGDAGTTIVQMDHAAHYGAAAAVAHILFACRCTC